MTSNYIQAQIEQLTAQLNQYRTLETQMEETVKLFSSVKETALALNASSQIEQDLMEMMGITATIETPVDNEALQKVQEYEALISNRDFRIANFEKQYALVAKERDEKNAEISELRNAIALLEQKFESQTHPQIEEDFEDEFEDCQPKEEAAPVVEEKPVITEQEARESILPPEPVQLSLPSIEVDSLVQTPDGQVGRVIYLKNDLATVKLPGSPANFHLSGLRYLGKYEPTPVEQILKSATWEEMRDTALAHPEALVEAMKQQPSLERTLPGQIAVFINIKGKAFEKDLYNIPTVIADSVRSLLDSPNLTATIKPASAIPYAKVQKIASDLYAFKTWAQIRAVLQSFAPATKSEILKEMAKTANNKTKTKFIENLPSLIAKYCADKSDRSDLEWLPDVVSQQVEKFLEQQAAA